ncbi:MAG: winged helix DNA-binding protein [Bacilli bacterium]|nr:winged helix DNA-binding protein [Bacilli bacterium]
MLERFQKFSYVMSEIYRYWHKIASDEMSKWGLKGPYAVYLTTIYQHKNGITSAQLCESCARDKSDVSKAVSLMEEKGLIKRESIKDNLYRALLKLTDEGKKAAESICKRAELAVEKASKGISKEERQSFYKTIYRIVDNLQVISEEGLS